MDPTYKVQKYKNTKNTFCFQHLEVDGARVESDWVLERSKGLLNGCESDLVKVDLT